MAVAGCLPPRGCQNPADAQACLPTTQYASQLCMTAHWGGGQHGPASLHQFCSGVVHHPFSLCSDLHCLIAVAKLSPASGNESVSVMQHTSVLNQHAAREEAQPQYLKTHSKLVPIAS